jgi:transcriptional regulator with XRE-family HTH domain
MPFGLSSSKKLLEQLGEKEFRDEFVADQVRSRIALMIRTLREQYGLRQSELGERMGKPQSVVSRLEDPDYGKESLQTLLEIAAAFDLPLLVDIPEWEDWLDRIGRLTKTDLQRTSFNLEQFRKQAQSNLECLQNGTLTKLAPPAPVSTKATTIENRKIGDMQMIVSVDNAA